MCKVMAEMEIEIPDWSISYLVNGDDSGLTKEDLRQVKNFEKGLLKKADYYTIDFMDGTSGFNPFPYFGQACDTTHAFITLWEE